MTKFMRLRSNLFANFLFKSSEGTGRDFHKLKTKTDLPLFEVKSLVRNFLRISDSWAFFKNASFAYLSIPKLELLAKALNINTNYFFFYYPSKALALASAVIFLHSLKACSVLALQLPNILSNANCK
jgi:hypothetical protein